MPVFDRLFGSAGHKHRLSEAEKVQRRRGFVPPEPSAEADPDADFWRQALGDEPEKPPESPAERWLASAEWEAVTSSNVAAIRYDRAGGGWLHVAYHVGPAWRYRVPEAAALALYHAPSKGTWLWDNVKVRGSVHQHRVPAERVG